MDTQARLTDLLHEQVQGRPDAVAVSCDGLELTYRALDRRSAALAEVLAGLGVVPDTPVGLYLEPSLELMVGAWGILTSGGAYLPLSPEYPHDRLRYMIENSAASVIVTQQHLAARAAALAPAGTAVVALGDEGIVVSGVPDGPRAGRPDAPPLHPEHLAYVLYTSGSTGRPKGVMIEHRSIVSQIQWQRANGHQGPGTVILQKTPMSFDAAQTEILAPAAGSLVVMGAPGVYRDPVGLLDAIEKYQVTALLCVPTLLRTLLDTGRMGACTSLRRLFSGGEALTAELARLFTVELPACELVNLYGPTECAINTTSHLVGPDDLADGAASIVSIGLPVDRTSCVILDADGAPVRPGEKGELYVGGIQLARGYLNLPEQTTERFLTDPVLPGERLYRTGDLAYWNPDGTIQFAGRTDSQVKLRGYRVELEEIASAIEEHSWVRRAATVVADNPRTGGQNLIACVELDPKEAALMDQGNHGAHHQSKASKLQVMAQLSNPGLRDASDLAGRQVVPLSPGGRSEQQRREVFARKTYRFHDGGPVTQAELLELLRPRQLSGPPRPVARLTGSELGEILSWFGPFHSAERLLPKYAYASPGALYAVQLYLETGGVAGLAAGLYYLHPADHTLVRIGAAQDVAAGELTVHFLGRRQAIEPVYRNNIVEVLELETGHMLGVFDEVLPEYGLAIRPAGHRNTVKERLDVAAEDHYLGTFQIVPQDGTPLDDPVEIYLQAHQDRVDGLPGGLYRYTGGQLQPVSAELVAKRDVIAINQSVYESASFGITVLSRAAGRLEYVVLGRKLHHLQRNRLRIGLMSSGYSSKTGNPLPAAQRIDAILDAAGLPGGASYFCLGGKVSEEQILATGMREDSVHMRGPTEMIRDDLARLLPDYMLPNRVLVLDALPLTANGKIDTRALAELEEIRRAPGGSVHVPPHTPAELWLAQAWGQALNYADMSMQDSFFECLGDSVSAMTLIQDINREFGITLPLQTIFEHPRLADLAARIEEDSPAPSSRLVALHHGDGRPVFCWPGLGGYPMNLRPLAREAGTRGPFYGIQAAGINTGEAAYPTIQQMAAADAREIRRVQPEGPYRLWGYSFGARVAFETAYQLEQAGQQVEHLMLICAGNPTVRQAADRRYGREASWHNPAYVAVLYSVFTGGVRGPELDACLAAARDEDSFTAFIGRVLPALETGVVRRIIRVVAETYAFDYTADELAERHLRTPITLFKADGDDDCFLEGPGGYAGAPPAVVQLAGEHYELLRPAGVGELAAALRARLERR